MLELNVAVDPDWIEKEFSTVDFNDDRITNRFFEVAKRLAKHPEKPIVQACESRAAMKGAYRLFENDNFESSEILTSHYSATSKRMAGEEIILAIQDTSHLEFNGHKKAAGLGGLNRKFTDADRSIHLHPTLAVTTNGLPLGLVSYRTSTRPIRDNSGRINQRLKRLAKNTSERESARWIEALEETASNIDLAKHKVVHIADREADSYAFMVSACQKGMSFLVRSKGDRNLEFENGDLESVRTGLEQVGVSATIEIDVPKNVEQEERVAKASVKYTKAYLNPPAVTKKLDLVEEIVSLPVSVIQVKELESKQKKPIEWLLITDLEINNLNDALQIVGWYKLRWSIEIFFKILKSGCHVEECRLQSFEKLDKYIALMAIIAFRIFYLSKIARDLPDTSCSEILTDIEWKALFMRVNRTNKLPQKPPSIKEAVELIARLGGYLARKGDPPPGPIVIWRGWSVLSEAIETVKIMNGLI